MSDEDRNAEDGAYLGPLDVDALVDEVIASFASRVREAIRREDVVAVVRDLDLNERRLIRRATRLSVRWLRFGGTKRVGEDEPTLPFVYEQRFAPGVNVVHIPDNHVGKSSIMKTIKFAMTGDDGDYDADVKRWITDISLTFALDNHPYTVIVSSGGDGFQALLIDGEEHGGLEVALQGEREIIFDAADAASLREELKQFFFQRLGLKALSWTQSSSANGGTAAERSTSWLTYFQILLIPEGGDKYLLCDPIHAIGNQDGLIFSSFLGLNLTEPINRLGVETKKAKKAVEHVRQQAQQAVQEAEQLTARLEEELHAKRVAVDALVGEQRARRQALEDGDLARKLSVAQRELVEKTAEREELLARRETLNRQIAQDRSRAKRLREAIDLQLHFTGLEVRLCPNCDAAVTPESISREQTAHLCRLCGHPAHEADPETIEALEMQAVEMDEYVSRADRERTRLNNRLGQLRQEIERTEAEVRRLRHHASQDLSAALPTEDEEARRAELYQAIGRLQAEIDAANQRKTIDPRGEQAADLHRRVVERVRKKLQEKAEQRNRALLGELDRLTHDMAMRIGVESITGVECSATGKIKLMKSGTQASFGGLKNEGERLRVKLAFFLAMMRLGREAGLGRHPGFLMIDQPGSSEMVAEDVRELAKVFRQIDQDLRGQLQIICFTARPEFRLATEPDRVYGPQAGKYAF